MAAGHALASRKLTLTLIGWATLGILLIAGLVGTVAVLNRTVYSPGAFVLSYLETIAEDDIASALATPGVTVPGVAGKPGAPTDASTALLRSGVIADGPRDAQVLSETQGENGSYTITVGYRLGSERAESTYRVSPIPPLYGVLPRWKFNDSPLGVINLTVHNGALFTAGQLTLDTRAAKSETERTAFNQTAPYLAVTPALYSFNYHSDYLQASTATTAVTDTTPVSVAVTVTPTAAFATEVQKEVNSFLDTCATQQVLQPSGCPFGAVTNDRIVGTPQWTVLSYPTISLSPGKDGFTAQPTDGVAHISVPVRSLFNGSASTLEQNQPIRLSLSATVRTDGSIAIQLL